MLRRSRRGRVAVALALAVAALAPALSPTGAAAQAPAPPPCDADGDGASTGTAEVVFSDGADDAARRLKAEAGYTLAAARPAWRWRVAVCVERVVDADPSTPERVTAVTGAPVAELDPMAPAWERTALAQALERLGPNLYRPGPRTSPPVNGVQVVNLETWLAVDPGAWVPVTESATHGEVSVTVTATPTKVVWEFSDGVTRVCDGPGTQYTPGAPGPAPCGHTFEVTTEVRPVDVAVSIDYLVTWSSTIANRGTLGRRGEAGRYELKVGEVQTYLSDGSRVAPAAPGALPLPESTRPADDEDCGWTTPWRCSPADVVRVAAGVAGDIAWDLLPAPAKEAVQAVLAFLQGCASFVGDALGSMGAIFGQFGQLMTDAGGFVRDKLEVAQTVFDAVRADPAGFAAQFLGDAVEVDLLRSDPARWAGRIGCEIAVGILTAGAAASAGRFASIFADLGRFTERVRDWVRRNDDGDGDGPGACRASSFPTATPVLMADGSHRGIEAVRPGDAVLAFDPAGGTWAPRVVERQWSYLDTDEMATLRLAGGATVSATDHHRFWSASRGDFAEAETLGPGEVLVTPAGPVAVEAVSVWPSGPTLVWELTVAVDHTFAVVAGDHAVAVHNRCDPAPGTADIERALGRSTIEGVTVADVQDAWSRYTGNDAPDVWLRKYITLRENVGGGTQYEIEILGRVGVDKNNAAFPPDQPTFIPDGVRSTDPPGFVEVKRYDNTVLYPNSNAGKQLEYLRDWANNDPTGPAPSFELWISNEAKLSDGFRERLTEAADAGVEVMVNGAPWQG